MSPIRPLLLVALVLSTGCSLAFQSETVQCSTDADCTARGSAFAGTVCQANVCVEKPDAGTPVDPKWGCVGNVKPLQGGKMDTLTTHLIDLITSSPVTGVTIKLCNKYDPPCATPIGTPTLGSDGGVTVTVPSDTEAYLEITGNNYIPTLLFLDHRAEATNPDDLMVPMGTVTALSSLVGVPYDDTKGILLTRTTDCTLKATGGVAISIFPAGNATRFYTINNLTTPNASETDSSGNAGFLNVDPGTPTVTGTIGSDGKTYGSVTTLMRAGHMTALIVPPTPLN